jgi:ribonuclease VapC
VIVDSSAIVSIIVGEADAEALHDILIKQKGPTKISAANYLETGIVVDGKRNPALSNRLDFLLSQLDIEVAPVTPAQAKIARQAYRDFGRGSGHPAKLNFGDCFAYALAIDRNEPLLFKGDDFTHTGVRTA